MKKNVINFIKKKQEINPHILHLVIIVKCWPVCYLNIRFVCCYVTSGVTIAFSYIHHFQRVIKKNPAVIYFHDLVL